MGNCFERSKYQIVIDDPQGNNSFSRNNSLPNNYVNGNNVARKQPQFVKLDRRNSARVDGDVCIVAPSDRIVYF